MGLRGSSDLELQQILARSISFVSASTIYSHLEDSDGIRLLYLLPRYRKDDDSIRCSIKHVKLSQLPQYEALSYMWGPDGNHRPIDIDGNICYVRCNLWSALYHLRLEDEARVLWIDAICINQNDVAERNYQVTQMGRIYSNASRAVVWLGESSSESSIAISVLSKTGQDSDWASFSENSILYPPTTEGGLLKLDAIRSMCYREYWTRLWIIQEVLLSTDILLCCGDESLPWSCLSSFFSILTKPFSSSLEATGLTHKSESLIRAIDDSIPARLFRDASKRRHLQSWDQPTHRTLFGLCVEYGEAKCEDRRDKIFGLHAFARECCRRAAPVDYALSWYETYSMVLLHYVLQHTDRKLLGYDVCVSQEFHEKLGFTSKETLHSMPSKLRLEQLAQKHMRLKLDALPIKFRGNIRGRVIKTVPLWSKVIELPDTGKFPLFLQAYVSQLRFINNLHPHEPTQKHRVTRQIDLVWSADQGVSRVTCSAKPSFPNYLGRTDPRTGTKQNLHFQGTSTAALQDNIQTILEDAQEAVRGTPFADCVLAFEENGLICFAPRQTRTGDIFCQFLSSDVLAVVRPYWKGYTLVGRAVSFLASSPKIPFQALPIRKYLSKDFDVALCEVLFEMDILRLQMMTRASVYPDDASEVMQASHQERGYVQ